MTDEDPTEVIRDRLERRLHHAKDVSLDVVVDNTSEHFMTDHSDLLEILLKLGPVERWYSLQVRDSYIFDDLYSNIALAGRFISLRVLTVFHNGWSSTSRILSDLFQSIARSRSPLKHLGLFTEQRPIDLEILLQLQTIRSFSGNLASFLMLPEDFIANLREVRLDGTYSGRRKTRELPQCQATITNFSPWTPTIVNVRNVTTLIISVGVGWEELHVPIELPNLHTLHLRPYDPHFLQVIKAPRIQVLRISREHKEREYTPLKRVSVGNKTPTHLLMQRDRRLLTIYPVSVTIDVTEIPNKTFLAMLKVWPQLKHLSIVLDGSFDCFGIFAERLLDDESPLFPNLETMYMEVDWHVKGQKWNRWRAVAKEMMLASKNLPLRSIIWRNSWFGVESVIQNNM
ncbi:hypothetical protein FRC19_011225 [Serendipita sp. 401]|nr:hypothetical protein FRC19_011225 [Serendipita sp. 401]